MANNLKTDKDVGSRPVPDPTVLTTLAVDRGVGALRELLETRLDAMDKAIKLLQDATDKIPASIDAKVARLQELHKEKFDSIQTQFRERDTRTEQSSKDSKVAVDAALQAAKEAVGEQNKSSALAIAKSEAATNKQLDGISALISQSNKQLDEKINDLKGRLDRGEGSAGGSRQATVEYRQSNQWTVGLLMSVPATIIAVVLLIKFLSQ